MAALGTEDFPRLRIGVGGGAQRSLSSHVLGRFSAEEEAVVGEAIQKAVEAIEVFVAVGIVAAMDKYNRKDDKKTEDN
jgi:PTH1 family peptidyl-tRNA hydrolase